MNLKKIKTAIALTLGVTTLTGCMGQMGVTQLVTAGNLKVVDNRYGRAGIYILISPIYAATASVDLFVFNSIEFWTGTNIITGQKTALVDKNVGSTVIKVNNQIDPAMTKPPVPAIKINNSVKSSSIQKINKDTLELHAVLLDGKQQVIRGTKLDDSVAFYIDGNYVTTVKIEELENYVATSRV